MVDLAGSERAANTKVRIIRYSITMMAGPPGICV